jgi:anti-sigma factor RsiW
MSDSAAGRTRDSRLDAYYDGELSRFARWRMEREIRRSPALRRELEELSRLGAWMRESQAEPPSPDLWDEIALRLPAVEARRAETARSARRYGFLWLAWPGAAVATALVVVGFAFDWFAPTAPASEGVVRWLDTGGRDVIVLEEGPDTTIVWVFGAPRKSAREGGGGERL